MRNRPSQVWYSQITHHLFPWPRHYTNPFLPFLFFLFFFFLSPLYLFPSQSSYFTMSKTDQKACLSTSSPATPPSSSSPPGVPRHEDAHDNPKPNFRPLAQRIKTAPAAIQTPQKKPELDLILVFCFILLYLELGWLILLLLHSYSRH